MATTDEGTGQEQQDESGESNADSVKNLKSEFNRKLDNQDKVIAEQNRILNDILTTVQSKNVQQSAPTAAQQEDLKELVFKDPDRVAEIMTQRAITAASQVVDDRVQRSQQAQAAVNEVMAHYPEFGQAGSEAAALAISKMSKLPRDQQGTPFATKNVMMEAALELGLVPAKARKAASGNEDFTLSGSQGGGNRSGKRGSEKTSVSADTLEFAQLMGIDIKDEKRMKGLEAASQRKIWNQYK